VYAVGYRPAILETVPQLGIEVEYELHAMKELLPRDLFKKAPELFRMNDKGERTTDSNCCVHSERGWRIIAENAVQSRQGAAADDRDVNLLLGRRRTTAVVCARSAGACLPSEQALVVENRICQALRKSDPKAQVAHLAYHNTSQPPRAN